MKTCAQLGLPAPSPNTTVSELKERITVPALMMLAERDVILQPVLADGMERWCDQLTTVMIRRGGHWAQIEETEQVNEALQEWMTSTVMKQAKTAAGDNLDNSTPASSSSQPSVPVAMPKRAADLDLNQNNVDGYDNDDIEEEGSGGMKAANKETLKQRVIVKARRRKGGGDSTPSANPAAAATG